jgi:glycosyltransferase involved in cell wall biosynthesis
LLDLALGANSASAMEKRPVSILFNVYADADNYNAQSLNAREIALRLDPDRFRSTVFYWSTPDPRLLRTRIKLVNLPHRFGTVSVLREMLAGYDLIFYIGLSRASYVYLHLPRFLRGSTRTVLCIEGTSGNLDGVSPQVRKYADYVSGHADVHTAISDFVARDTLEAFGIQPDFVVPVGVDTEAFSPPASRDHPVTTVLFVGHLVERKGPQLVLDAAAQFPQAQFRLVGSPRDAFGETLRRRSEELKLHNVNFEDPVPQLQLAEIMRASDILLLPSRVEGIPKVTLEAAATGLPCVVFDDYQTPSVVDGSTGFQVKTFEEMLKRLGLLIENITLRQEMSGAAVVHARQFNWDRVVERWSEILSQIVRRDS